MSSWLLFLLSLALPASAPDPLILVSEPPSVARFEFPSDSGRRMVADLYQPAGAGHPRPGVLLANPAARGGLENRAMQRVAKALARLGYVVVLPYPEGKAIASASPADIVDARASLMRFAALPGVDRSRSVAAGLSYGSGPLLLAAPQLTKANLRRHGVDGGSAFRRGGVHRGGQVEKEKEKEKEHERT